MASFDAVRGTQKGTKKPWLFVTRASSFATTYYRGYQDQPEAEVTS
jgi:hypothetical protein